MTVREQPEIEKCDFCEHVKFNVFPSKDDNRIIECSKCKAVKDLTARAEDVKHQIYHETGREPYHKDTQG